jgi:hypothetical protein
MVEVVVGVTSVEPVSKVWVEVKVDLTISPYFRINDWVEMKFFNICGVGGHSLEYCPIVLDKIITKIMSTSYTHYPKKKF